MKPTNESFPPEVLNSLKGIYLTDGETFLPIIPESDLTKETFSIIDLTKNVRLYADDFSWCADDGSDRDFSTEYADYYGYTMPDELSAFLNSFICVNFADQNLAKVKNVLNGTNETVAKAELDKAIENFERTTSAKEKLKVALHALEYAIYFPTEGGDMSLIESLDYDVFKEIKNAISVIDDVIHEI